MMKVRSASLSYAEVFLCMLWGRKLLSYITAICLRLPGINAVAFWIVPIMIVMVLILASKELSKNITIGNVLFCFVVFLVFVSTYLFFPDNSQYIDNLVGLFSLSILPFVFVGKSIDINKLFTPFYFISLLCVLTELLNVLFLEQSEREMSDFGYDMYAAYRILPHILMVLWHLMRKINIVDIVVVLLGLFLLFGYGTRGAIMCIGVFVALYLIFGNKWKKKWLYVIVIFFVFSMVYGADMLMDSVGIGIDRFGLSSRIINAYETDMLNDDSGRGFIQGMIIKALSNAGAFGLGICGDRVATSGSYSHNIIIEFWSSFGYFVGSALFVILIWFVVKAWRTNQTLYEKGFLILLISEAAHLFVSDSFLLDAHFFVLIGFCSRIIQTSREKKEFVYFKE